MEHHGRFMQVGSGKGLAISGGDSTFSESDMSALMLLEVVVVGGVSRRIDVWSLNRMCPHYNELLRI